MSRAAPWDDIRTPEADYNVRKIGGVGPIPMFWGRDTDGHCLLLIELEGDHASQLARENTSAHGITVDLRRSDAAGCQNLVLALEKHVDSDLFLGLCETLVASLAPVTSSAAALSVTLTHIKRWKAFLAGRSARLLSAEEIRGLFAELAFLRSLYPNPLTPAAAVTAWSGADRVHQDFVFRDRSVEIKSLMGTDRSTVRISSEDQLETISERLFLVTYRLSEMPDSAQAISLNEAVSCIEGELQDPGALEEFSRKLATYGYAPLRDYDLPKLVVTGSQAYVVEEGFPRLIRSQLPAGIARVSYQIELEAIAAFKCPFHTMLEG